MDIILNKGRVLIRLDEDENKEGLILNEDKNYYEGEVILINSEVNFTKVGAKAIFPKTSLRTVLSEEGKRYAILLDEEVLASYV
tara:strand:+ start:500 stop:751 length:252 start_codon:yes stop_codon:yes gene_type:complete